MLSLLLKHSKLIFVWGLVAAILSAGLSMLLPRQYSADSRVLIISRDRTGVDPYTQAKSAERIGENLAQVMATTDFFNKVMNSSAYPFDKDVWTKLSEREQRKKWTRDVVASMVYGTGLMNIKAHSYSDKEAKNLSVAITQTVSSQGWEYLGGDVAIKVVNSPLVSRWPTRPNIPVNALAGFLLGGALGSLWVARYKKHLFS